MIPSVWLSEPEFITFTVVFIALREKRSLHFSPCAKLACCRRAPHAVRRRIDETKGPWLRRRDENEETKAERWKERWLHPGNASKQEDVASLFSWPHLLVLKKEGKETHSFVSSLGIGQSSVHFTPHRNCNQSLWASRMVSSGNLTWLNRSCAFTSPVHETKTDVCRCCCEVTACNENEVAWIVAC